MPLREDVLGGVAGEVYLHARGRPHGRPCPTSTERVAVRPDAHVIQLVGDGGAQHGVPGLVVGRERPGRDALRLPG